MLTTWFPNLESSTTEADDLEGRKEGRQERKEGKEGRKQGRKERKEGK